MFDIPPIEPQNAQLHKTDLRLEGWITRYLPTRLHPYATLMRLDRPIGTWLLLLPGLWGIALAFRQTGDFGHAAWLFLLFGVGAVVMRGAGCVINDLWDRDFDGRVARTRTRPLVTGSVTPRQAMVFTAFLGLIGLGILLQMNNAAILIGLCSLPFIVAYPLMKRITWWPQLVLGLTFNFGALMGWAAMTGGLALPPVWLYIAGIFWTLGYDTIYAHMDKDDDALIGVKSTARLLGEHSPKAIAGFYGMSAVFLFLALYDGAANLWVLPGMIAIIATFLYQIKRLDLDDPAACLRLFRFNRDQGLVILAVILICAYAAA